MRPAAGAAGSMASMEWEPKALSLHELKYAREAALYVLRTNSSEDAVRIFTEGLKPVLGVRKDYYSMADSDEDDDQGEEDYDMFNPYASLHDESICCHQYGRTVEERHVATAPF